MNPDVTGYIDSHLIHAVLKIIIALAVVALLVLKSKWLDKRLGIDFKEIYDVIKTDARALAKYHGLRWIGICLIGVGVLLVL